MKNPLLSLSGADLIGIEIGNSGVRMASCRDGSARMAFARLPENLVADDHIASPEMVSKFLKEMKSQYGFSGRRCAIILPEYSTFFRNLTMPPVNVGQLELNLPFEFRDFTGDSSGNFNYDYAVENTNYNEEGEIESIDMVAAAAMKDVINQYALVLRRAGFRLQLALPREMALINLVRSNPNLEEDKEFAIVELGYNLSRVYIFKGTSIKASRIIDAGCRDIDNAISGMFNIDTYIAASYRETNYQDVISSEICKGIYNSISLEIMKVMNFYRYENPDTAIEDVYFSGSGSSNSVLLQDITNTIDLAGHPVTELIPLNIDDEDLAAKCLMAIAVTMQKGGK